MIKTLPTDISNIPVAKEMYLFTAVKEYIQKELCGVSQGNVCVWVGGGVVRINLGAGVSHRMVLTGITNCGLVFRLHEFVFVIV